MKTTELSVLVIDDDQLFCEKMKHSLLKFSSQVFLSHSAENGSHLVQSVQPDLIFLDNQLPHLNGNEVITFYKELSPNSKIILMSGQFDMSEVVLAIENKADYLLNKKEINLEQIQKIVDAFPVSKTKKKSLWRLLGTFEPKLKDNQLQVAVVEDDELFSFHLTWKLGLLLPKYSINSFANGKSFFEFCGENNPQVILLDYHLPDYTGKEILDFIKETLPEAKVIILSSQNDPDVAISIQQLGIAGYMLKNMDWTIRLEQYIEELGL